MPSISSQLSVIGTAINKSKKGFEKVGSIFEPVGSSYNRICHLEDDAVLNSAMQSWKMCEFKIVHRNKKLTRLSRNSWSKASFGFPSSCGDIFLFKSLNSFSWIMGNWKFNSFTRSITDSVDGKALLHIFSKMEEWDAVVFTTTFIFRLRTLT